MKRSFYLLLGVLMLNASILLKTQAIYAQEPARTIEIHAHRFSFEPSEITLKRGETVRLQLVSEDVTHSLLIPDLKINQEIKKGKSTDVILTPDSVGDFHGQCGHFCGGGHGSMLFVIHVKE